jgi:hypothetical protein
MELLFKHLGISTPPDLKQGQLFNKGIHEALLDSKYNGLQEGSPASLMSSIETMANNDTVALTKLDIEFKQLLSEYTGLLNTVNREIMQEQQKYGPMNNFLGKRLKTNNQDSYINEYGYARNIPLSDMIDSSCPKSSELFKNSCQGLSDAYGVSYSVKAAPPPPVVRKPDRSTPCAADYGKKIGDLLSGNNGTVTAISQTCSDPEYPICNGFKQGVSMGKCLKNIQLGAAGSSVCPGGMMTMSESECDASAKLVLPAGKTMGRTIQVGSWPQVPPGCSLQSNGDWTPHYNKGSGKNDGEYSLVCEDTPATADKLHLLQKNRGNKHCYATKYENKYLLAYSPSATKCNIEAVGAPGSCTFDEAKSYCDELSDCAGVTQSPPNQGGGFTVRQGTAGLKPWSGPISWLKTDCASPSQASTDTTDFGCAPDFAKEWWKQHSCKTKPSSSKRPGCDINNMNTSIFKKGPDMNPGEPCHLAGKNIRNSKTNQVAWVDLTGVKHIYPNQKMRDNLIGCNTKVTVTLDDDKYTNVPTGPTMTLDSICLNISVNEHDYTKLLKMNKKLQVLASKIVNELDTVISKDSEMETNIRSKKSTIHKFLNNLKKERKNFDENKHLLKTMKHQSEESHVSYVSNKYHMIAWGLLLVGVGGFTVHQLSTRKSL